MRDFHDFNTISIKLASPERIREWSYGEVKKPETINYRTLKPERDGLFCEKIFGTTKDWECFCGKFKSIRYKGVVCDKCHVEVTHSRVRRERMGHIELSYPVAHIWYYRTAPSRIAQVLDMSSNDIKSILYFERYVIIDPGDSGLEPKQLISPDDYTRLQEIHGDKFYASIGADAVKELLSMVNLEEEIRQLRAKIGDGKKLSDRRLLKRLEILEAFRDSGNRPEWMILDVIPVLPPELRPMVQLEGGRFATSDLNDLYRRVINRNNRLKRLLALKAPDIIVQNEKRMLQEAVDALFDNSRRNKAIKGKGNRPLKSLSDMLKGKQGRFRQNLLGKRVDYSGRTVIVVGPELKIYQCGLPKKMALELFKPFIMKWLVDHEYTQNIKSAKRMIENEEREVFQGLEEVTKEHPVLLNRAPTLHRLGIQAFLPVLIEGKAIQLHPLVCHAFNADFDGDQMAIHVPLSPRAQLEAWMLILSAHNLLNPANGQPIVGPTQDMILGLYYLTAEMDKALGEGQIYDNIDEVIYALERGLLEPRAKIRYYHQDRLIETTPGRLLFNQLLPPDFPFVNRPLTSKSINEIIADLYKAKGAAVTVKFLDAIKKLGFQYATRFAPTISLEDVKIPESKSKIIEKAIKEVERVENEHRKGIITNEERYKKVIDIWTVANERITEDLFTLLSQDQGGFNPIYAMAISGARGSRSQIRQLAGMRGLMSKPSGDIIELAIRSNFKEGLSVLEFFISTSGARKGLADTALKTADAGYLTRRLVDVAQDVIIREDDCGTSDGFDMMADKEGDKVIVSLKQKIYGRYLQQEIRDPTTDEVILIPGTFITEEIAQQIENLGYEKVKVRSILTCESMNGVCRMCYGMDLATLAPVEKGEAVGIIAAQSIGQPGTQLTMRTFHVGGTATTKSAESRLKAPYDAYIRKIQGRIVINREKKKILTRRGSIILAQVLERFNKKDVAELAVPVGEKVIKGEEILRRRDQDGQLQPVYASQAGSLHEDADYYYLLASDYSLALEAGSIMYVEEASFVKGGELICEFDPYNNLIVATASGKVEYIDIELGKTLKIQDQEKAGISVKKIVSYRKEKLVPRFMIYDKGKLAAEITLPVNSILQVENGAMVHEGDILAKIETKAEKTRDITGGLPRIDELFEARHPKEACHLAEIDGIIRDTGQIVRDKRIIYIQPLEEGQEEVEVAIPISKQILVQDGESVSRGEPLSSGVMDPHDILRILGEEAVQRYLIREIQEVYRLQGVSINDKHIEIIIRQMMRKVEVIDAGDTNFLPMTQVDKVIFKRENQRVMKQGGAPATSRPVLLGLTKASLNSESFLSAASFQETTRVLTEAAIKGKVDHLEGLKENIIIGNLIPAGTGLRDYRRVRAYKHVLGDLYYTEEELEKIYKAAEPPEPPLLTPIPASDEEDYQDEEE
ncbi:MAG: DNA-directed RNA polymerase subunit beta' [Leptospiraceae bacterium]|nr:DNA-directed RNA polymerase subunit beta' [Leptospiraceae bacterium]MDW8305579.1 DNA-directed RNA polymerase subunit beta' [Leptospiraceae bacterium]